jgi:hypothetical protein
MQLAASDALDLSQETAATQEAYGIGREPTDSYGRRCLIARRLIERGVRFVQIFVEGQIWDTHNANAAGTKSCCEQTDQPTAALLTDLKRRGLFDSVLLMWGGEFGRTPLASRAKGGTITRLQLGLRRRHPRRPAYGNTDELGYHATENRTMVADLHATVLLFGLDHKRVNTCMAGMSG